MRFSEIDKIPSRESDSWWVLSTSVPSPQFPALTLGMDVLNRTTDRTEALRGCAKAVPIQQRRKIHFLKKENSTGAQEMGWGRCLQG